MDLPRTGNRRWLCVAEDIPHDHHISKFDSEVYLTKSYTTMSLNETAAQSRLHNLASWAANLRYEDIPPVVIGRTKEFFLDTIACTIAGRDHAAIIALAELAKKMGPSAGPCEVIPFPSMKTSPAFAALINGACSHVVEQDDLHNSSMMHPVHIPRILRFTSLRC